MGFELPFVIGPEYIAVALFGVVIGIIFGAIPGMTATMAVAVFLPLTYAYSMEMALYLLLGLYVGGISGGLVPAILINIPGTPSSVCTTFDGHPMALRGEGERALKIGVTSSFMGGMISLVVLALFTPHPGRLGHQVLRRGEVPHHPLRPHRHRRPVPGPDAPRPVDRYAGRAGGHDEPVLRQQ